MFGMLSQERRNGFINENTELSQCHTEDFLLHSTGALGVVVHVRKLRTKRSGQKGGQVYDLMGVTQQDYVSKIYI